MKSITSYKKLQFEIEEDLPVVGFYIYIYDNEGKCIADYLQDTEEMAKEFVYKKYGVPIDSWEKEK